MSQTGVAGLRGCFEVDGGGLSPVDGLQVRCAAQERGGVGVLVAKDRDGAILQTHVHVTCPRPSVTLQRTAKGNALLEQQYN